MQIRYKDLAKLGILAFKGLSIKAEPTVSRGETVGSSFILIPETQNQRGTESARGPGVIMHPGCILFIYSL